MEPSASEPRTFELPAYVDDSSITVPAAEAKELADLLDHLGGPLATDLSERIRTSSSIRPEPGEDVEMLLVLRELVQVDASTPLGRLRRGLETVCGN